MTKAYYLKARAKVEKLLPELDAAMTECAELRAAYEARWSAAAGSRPPSLKLSASNYALSPTLTRTAPMPMTPLLVRLANDRQSAELLASQIFRLRSAFHNDALNHSFTKIICEPVSLRSR